MALSHHEQQALNRIALELHAQDPLFASTLDHDGWITRSTRRRHRRLPATAAFSAGIALLTSAILIPHRTTIVGVFTVSIVAYVAMFSAALWWCGGPIGRRRRAEAGTDEPKSTADEADS